jgi:hypothetical protein
VTLEVYHPARRADDLAGRFDFTLDYGYYPGGDGDLWLDPDTVAYTIAKNGAFPARCEYRIIAETAPGRPDVTGWAATDYRSTAGFTRHAVGTAIGGGSLGAALAYYTRSGK